MFDFNGMGITLENVKTFEEELKAYKASLRAGAKATRADAKASIVEQVNALIASNALTAGMNVIIKYKNADVQGVVKTANADSENLTIISDAFENKNHTCYVKKSNFVALV